MTKKYYICDSCNCKCTVELGYQTKIEKLNFPCQGGDFKEVEKREYKRQLKENK